jgi:hypothetical protein
MSTFIYVIAWFVACLSTIITLATVIAAVTYTCADKLIDQMRGIKRTFKIFWPFVIAFIAWAYIITKPF